MQYFYRLSDSAYIIGNRKDGVANTSEEVYFVDGLHMLIRVTIR